MIRSMTGYGSAKGKAAGLYLNIEIRSVNNKYLDINIKLPRTLLFAEDTIKGIIQSHTSRGKIDVFVSVDSAESDPDQIHVNQLLAASYRNAIAEVGSFLTLPVEITALDIARFPDVLISEKPELDQDLFIKEIQMILCNALNDFNSMREREGLKLKEDILSKADTIEKLVMEISKLAPDTIKAYRERLENKIREVLSDAALPEDRIVAEVALFSDRIATDEEIVRLNSHLSQFRHLTLQGSPIGRKLDFLIQEFNREANTIGSKCQNSAIAYLVVELKSEIEKVREQIQNIE